jgi:integrase
LVKELVLAFWKRSEQRYKTADGKPARELEHIQVSIRPVRELYGETPVSEFGPVAFEAVRAQLIAKGLALKTISHRMSRVRRMFRWGSAHGLVPADTHHRLEAVDPLERDREGVRDTDPVEPVSRVHVDVVLPHVQPAIQTMVELQWLSGMRPGEVIRMTTGAIDRSRSPWIYKPRRHKTARLGAVREICLGPKAQLLLQPWLKADPDAPLFSPVESVRSLNAEKRKNRKTPMTPSQAARRPKKLPKRAPRQWFGTDSYGKAIRRACVKAGVPIWGPNRLRHSFATAVRHLPNGGLEASQVLLGHAKADVTQVYAVRNRALAEQVIQRIG